MMRYRVDLTPDDNGTLLVTCPDLPIVVTFGEDRASAIRHALDAIETALASMIDDREEVPMPSGDGDVGADGVRLPLQTELKVRLYMALRVADVTRAELQRRLGWQHESVDRLFRLDHDSRIEQLERAFEAIGKSVGISVEEAA